jgi:signal transduction histidine kinase
MRELIDDLLDFSKATMGPLELAATDSREALEGALANLRGSIETSGASVQYGELAFVRANACQLQQLFQNLIGNALKYRGAEPPVVEVATERVGDDWHFTISDNGMGIALEHRERIFEMFKRLHTRAEIPGSGIGLALCRSIVERHGGRIWVESTPGKGSRFHFTMPSA